MTHRPTAPRILLLAATILAACTLLVAAAREPANDYTMGIIGDRTGGHHPGIFERVWREVGLLNPDFAINVGDTIEGYIRDEAQIPTVANQQWDEIFSIIDKYQDIPKYFVTGNHDIWGDSSEAIYKQRTGFETDYTFRYQESLFVCMDNSRVNELSDEQYAYLEKALDENADASPKFVFFHKPFWIGFVRAGDTNNRFHQLCRAKGVDWVITGHGHQLTYNKFDGVDYLEVGSSGGGIGLNEDGSIKYNFGDGRFFHYVIGRVRGNTVEMTVKEIEGGGGKGRVFDLKSWQDTHPLFNPEEEPFVGEANLGGMTFQSPANGATVQRGVVPLVAAARVPAGRPPVLTIDGTAVTPDAGNVIALCFDIRDLNSTKFQDLLAVNGEQVMRLSPDKELLPWSTVIVPITRDLWQRRTPPEVTFIAGTATDGTGQDLPENNDDYFVRDLLAYDGTQYLGCAELPAGAEQQIGDNGGDAITPLRTLKLAEPRQPANLVLMVHAWDTTGVPAGDHTLELTFAGRTHSITVTVE